MRLRLRLLFILLISLWRKPLYKSIFTQGWTLSLRVLPNDALFRQVTPDRLQAYIQLALFYFLANTDIALNMLKHNWVGIVGSVHIEMNQPLYVLSTCDLHSEVINFQDNWFWFKHSFIKKGQTVGVSYSKVQVRKGKEVIGPNEFAQTVGRFGPIVPRTIPSTVMGLEDLLYDRSTYTDDLTAAPTAQRA